MSSPLNDSNVTDWFRRLDAAWRRMPADEQQRQREEVQQHLEGLVTAKVATGQSAEDAWNAALVQFGNPAQIGRKVYQEWRQSQGWLQSDVAVILFVAGVQQLSLSVLGLLQLSQIILHQRETSFNPILSAVMHGGLLIFAYAVIGRRYPFQAIKGAFYGYLLWSLGNSVSLGVFFSQLSHPYLSMTFQSVVIHNLLWMPLGMIEQITVMYLASVTKRGWYKPTLNDFKIILPSRIKQNSR